MSAACPSCSQVGLVPTAPAYPGCPPPPPAVGCPAVWGAITGDIQNQQDLAEELELFARLAQANVFAEDQTINGVFAGSGGGTGTDNTRFGGQSFAGNTTGSDNVAVGFNALATNTTGNSNTAVGSLALDQTTTGGGNTALGYRALTASVGIANTAVGVNAGAGLASGDNNTAIGANSGVTGGLSNTTAIGSGAVPTKSNQVVIGDSAVDETVLKGNVVLDSKTITAIGTTGAQTINETCGSVVFAGAATSLVVTNSFAIAPTSGGNGSIIGVFLRTADATAVLGSVVCAANGSFTINMKVAPTGATRVDFILFN